VVVASRSLAETIYPEMGMGMGMGRRRRQSWLGTVSSVPIDDGRWMVEELDAPEKAGGDSFSAGAVAVTPQSSARRPSARRPPPRFADAAAEIPNGRRQAGSSFSRVKNSSPGRSRAHALFELTRADPCRSASLAVGA